MLGLSCSLFLLNATIRSQVEKHLGENTEKLLLQFLRDLYADDTATSFNDLTKATEFYHLTKNILAIGGFNLRKWETNNSILQNIISQEKTLNDIQNEKTDESIYVQSQLGFSSHAFPKVLGLNLDTNNDFLVRICRHNRCCFQIRNYKTKHSSRISYVLRSFGVDLPYCFTIQINISILMCRKVRMGLFITFTSLCSMEKVIK